MRQRAASLILSLLLLSLGANNSQTAPAQVVVPDADQIMLLLRSTLLTLNDAIQTGNYTVLRDVGAPDFSTANSAARLSQSFSDLASRGIDLSLVTIMAAIDSAAGPRPTERSTLFEGLFSR